MKKRRRKKHYHTGDHTSVKLVGKMRYRSGWELALAVFMDNDPNIESYSYESVVVPYVANVRTGRLRKYYVDFLVMHVGGKKTLVEVKPQRKLKQRVVQKKIESAKRWCADNDAEFAVITEVELKSMGCM